MFEYLSKECIIWTSDASRSIELLEKGLEKSEKAIQKIMNKEEEIKYKKIMSM